jgi:hypothetical protein
MTSPIPCPDGARTDQRDERRPIISRVLKPILSAAFSVLLLVLFTVTFYAYLVVSLSKEHPTNWLVPLISIEGWI